MAQLQDANPVVRRRAFTLVELLVVIAIIGVLVALLLPAIQAAREAARRMDCANRLRQIGLACQNFHGAQNRFPSSSTDNLEEPVTSNSKLTQLSYVAQILPYMEQQSLHNLVDLKKHWAHANNETARTTPLPSFRCPSQNRAEPTFMQPPGSGVITEENDMRTHYHGVMGAKTGICTTNLNSQPYPKSSYTLGPNCDEGHGGSAINGVICPRIKVTMKDVTDGTSQTFIVGELAWEAGAQRVWLVGSQHATIAEAHNYSSKNIKFELNTAVRIDGGAPVGIPVANNDMSFGSQHAAGGAHFAMCDGSVQFIRRDIDLEGVFLPLASRASDEVFQPPF